MCLLIYCALYNNKVFKNKFLLDFNTMSNSKGVKRKRTASCFKNEWLDEIVTTSTPKAHELINIQLREIFTYDAATGVVCIYCRDGRLLGILLMGRSLMLLGN